MTLHEPDGYNPLSNERSLPTPARRIGTLRRDPRVARDGYVLRVQIRPAVAGAVPALTAALLDAANWDGRARFSPEQVMTEPALAHYVAGWPRPGDFGAVAVTEALPGQGFGSTIGADWCRIFDETDAGYGFVAGDVPEFSVGVSARWLSQGVG